MRLVTSISVCDPHCQKTLADNLLGAEPTQAAVIQTLGIAFSWADFFESGKIKSISELARILDVDDSYVALSVTDCRASGLHDIFKIDVGGKRFSLHFKKDPILPCRCFVGNPRFVPLNITTPLVGSRLSGTP